MKRGGLTLLFVTSAVTCLAQSAQRPAKPSPADYFPLQVGNRWEYQIGGDAREIREVIGEELHENQNWFRILTFFTNLSAFHKPPSETLVRMKGSQLIEQDPDAAPDVMAADFSAQRGPWYPVAHRCAGIATNIPASSEIIVSYRQTVGMGCADTGIIRATFRANIGLVAFTFETFGGPMTRTLVSARIAGKEITFK